MSAGLWMLFGVRGKWIGKNVIGVIDIEMANNKMLIFKAPILEMICFDVIY